MRAGARPVGDATAAALVRLGMTTMFGVGGTHTVPLLGALERCGAIDFVAARTELGAAYMAIGYARATGRHGVVLTSTGPGALNITAALADAAWSSLPLLHVTTSIGGTGSRERCTRRRPSRRSCGSPAVRVVPVVDDAVDAAVDEAGSRVTGRPNGPVTVVLPPAAGANRPGRGPAGSPRYGRGPEDDDDAVIAELAAAIADAERPLIYAGGGAVRHDGGAAVRRLAETIGAPIVTSYQGKGIAGPPHPLWVGPTASEEGVRDCCCPGRCRTGVRGQAVGSRGRTSGGCRCRSKPGRSATSVGPIRTTRSSGRSPPTPPRLLPGLAGGARAPGRHGPTWPLSGPTSRPGRAGGANWRWGSSTALRDAPGTPALVAVDMTKAGFWLMKHLPVADGGRHAFSGYLAMGTALPMAIGTAVATGEAVLALVGDGALQMSLAELAVIAERQLPVTILVIVDGAYGMLAENAAAVGGSRRLGVELWNPDLPALARAFGFGCDEAHVPADLRRLLDKATAAPRMILLTQPFTRRW